MSRHCGGGGGRGAQSDRRSKQEGGGGGGGGGGGQRPRLPKETTGGTGTAADQRGYIEC